MAVQPDGGTPMAADRGSPGRFVGRTRELALLDAACGAAARGRGSVTVVAGEAGIGKTRLCEEVAERARRRGLTVVTARCWLDGGAPPLWPWQAILGELGGTGAAELLGATATPAGAGDATGDTAVGPDRFARFAAVTDRLAAACARAPVCLVVDDVHAADAGTLLLVRFVARSLAHMGLALVLSRRRDEPAGDRPEARLLDEIAGEAGSIVALPRFERDEAATFLAEHGLAGLDADLMATVVAVTGGNPLFLGRVAALGTPEADRALPGGVQVAIEQALARLSPEARAVLGAGAVLGLGPDVARTAAVAQRDPVAVLDAVAEAATVGLVAAEGPDRFSFTHELVRAAFEDDLAGAGRLDAHARAVAAVAGPGPVADTDRLARRAHHALAAAPRSPADAGVAVDACQEAARAMVRSFAYEQADRLLSAAVDLHRRARLGPPAGALMVAWAQAALQCGRMTEARTRFGRAAAVARREDDPVLFAEAALGLGGHWVNEHRAPVERARVLGLQRSALAGLPAAQPALRCRLEARLAAEAVFDGGPLAPVHAALDAARGCGDPVALAEALSLSHHALFGPDHTRTRLPLAGELVRVASEAGHGTLALMGLVWRAVDLFHLGDPAAARALEELRARANALECQNILYIVAVIDVMLLGRDGRLDEAEAAAGRAHELGVDAGEIDALGYMSAQMLGIRWCQGRDAELLDVAEDVAASPTVIKAEFSLRAAAAAIAARAGQHDRARDLLDRLAAGGLAALPRSSTWATGLAMIVEAAAELDDPGLARQAYDLLAPFADLPVVVSVAVTCLGSTERYLGLAASTCGDPDAAVGHLDRAVAANRRLGNRPLVAMASGDLAAALTARAGPGDRARAAELLERAIPDATAMGMMARAAGWQARLAALRAPARASSPTAGTRRGRIHREGTGWVVALDGRAARVPDLVGVAYLAELLTRPGRPIPALVLASRGEAAAHRSRSPSRQDVLDDEARASYEARAEQLRAAVAEAEGGGDADRAGHLQRELDALVDELAAATGLRRRPRAFSDDAERARVAVRKAIARAVDAVDRADTALADVLRATITTGASCAYTPDPRAAVTWSTRPPDHGDPPSARAAE